MATVPPGPRRGSLRRATPAAALLLLALAPIGTLAGDPDAGAPTASAELRQARAAIEAGRYREARDRAGRLLSPEAEAPALESSSVAAALDLLVEASWLEGAPWDGLLEAAQRAVTIREVLPGGPDRDLATSLINLCAVQRLLGDLTAARGSCERSVTLLERDPGPDHPEVAAGLNGLALILLGLREYAEARAVCDRALALREASRPPDPLGVAQILSTRGAVLRSISDLAGARLALEKAFAIREKELPPDHPLLAQALHNLGAIRYIARDSGPARELLERALAMKTRVYGPDHPDTASTLASLAAVLLDTSEWEAAQSAAEASLRIREQVFGEDHMLTNHSRLQLGKALLEQHDLPPAESVLRHALASGERTLGPDHPMVSEILEALSIIAGWRGDHARAEQLGTRSLAIRERLFGPDDPRVATSLLFMIGKAWIAERYDVALDRSLRAAGIVRAHARDLARQTSEREVLRYMETWRPALDAAVSAIAEPGPLPGLPADATSRVWDEIIRTRALVLDEMAARHRFALDIEDPGTDALVQGLHEARRRLSALMSERPDPVNPDLFSERLRQGREDEERSERALAERISGARDEELQRGVTFEQVAAALPRNAALIAYVRFTRVIPPQTAADQGQRPPDPRHGVPSYFALVLRAGASPVALLLGATAEIDARVTRWREEASSMPMDGSATRRYRAAGAKLREAIWDPLVSRLAGAGEVLIVPEGMINLVNFATLPVARDGYLIEQRRLLHYLSAERDLVRLSTRHPQAASAKGLLLFGGPEFDPGPVDRNPADRGRPDGRAIYRGPTPACASFRDLTFEPLPGAVAEVDRIRALWNASPAARSGGGSEAEVFVGPGADESTFKSVAAGHRIVHLATHAFFTGEGCDGTDAAAPMRAAEKPDPRPALLEENPLLLSGLAFAGANGRNDRAAAGRLDDGVLTAQEIASLDLRGVEWVVLSACGTGIGPIETGEGVMGLRRTFQIAGARSVVMSLWSVDDHSAREWTHRLYGSRLSGRSTAASLRDASLRLLEARRRAGVTTHPFSWGAFVAVGDWK